MEDQMIVELYWQREESAISETADKYSGYCHAIAYNILYDHEDARECVNDTWLHAWNAMPPHRPEKLSAFLGKITRNLSLDRYKRSHRKKRGEGQMEVALSELEHCIPVSDNISQVTEEQFLTESINGFLEKLPPVKRRIFLLRYWYVLSIREIAAETALSESKVTTILFRMRKQLKSHLEKEGIVL